MLIKNILTHILTILTKSTYQHSLTHCVTISLSWIIILDHPNGLHVSTFIPFRSILHIAAGTSLVKILQWLLITPLSKSPDHGQWELASWNYLFTCISLYPCRPPCSLNTLSTSTLAVPGILYRWPLFFPPGATGEPYVFSHWLLLPRIFPPPHTQIFFSLLKV